MTEKKNSVYRVIVTAAKSEEEAQAGRVLKLRYLVSAPSPRTARTFVPDTGYEIDGELRRAWKLPVVAITSIKRDPRGRVPAGLTIVGLDTASALSLRVMASLRPQVGVAA